MILSFFVLKLSIFVNESLKTLELLAVGKYNQIVLFDQMMPRIRSLSISFDTKHWQPI
mgnify:CR=1 FL=1